MSRYERIKGLLAALVFLALGRCLLLAANGMLAQAGVVREDTECGRLWRPRAAHPAQTAAEEDGHVHGLPGYGGALVLTQAFDGSRSLAAELARRGVTVLLAGRDDDPAQAWALLRERCGEEAPAAVLAGPERAEEALALLRELRRRGERCAGTVLLGTDAALRAAGDQPGGNLLLLVRSRPDREALTAFYGSEAGADRGFDGFYAEGTARACAWDRDFGSFARRETLLRVNDWMGSVLGHAVVLPDGDLIFDKLIFCWAGAAALAILSAGTAVCLFRRRGGV